MKQRTGLAIALFAATSLALAQQATPSYCDVKLVANVVHNKIDLINRYQARDKASPTRCEGTFGQQHGAEPLHLIGVWESCGHPQPADLPKNLELRWKPAATSQSTLKVRSVAGRPYVLDTRTLQSAFAWPNDILKSLKVARRDLAALAWTIEGGQPVYSPVRWADAATECTASYYVLLNGLVNADSVTVQLGLQGSKPSESWTERGAFGGPLAWVSMDLARFSLGTGTYVMALSFNNGANYDFLLRHTIP